MIQIRECKSEHEVNKFLYDNDSKYFDFDIVAVAVQAGDSIETRFIIKYRIVDKDALPVGWCD